MEIDKELNSLIRPRKVCLCKNVSEKDITRAYQEGTKTLKAIVVKTKATTGCGTCFNELVKIIENLRSCEKAKTKSQFFR